MNNDIFIHLVFVFSIEYQEAPSLRSIFPARKQLICQNRQQIAFRSMLSNNACQKENTSAGTMPNALTVFLNKLNSFWAGIQKSKQKSFIGAPVDLLIVSLVISGERGRQVGRVVTTHDPTVPQPHLLLVALHLRLDYPLRLGRRPHHLVGGLVLQQVFELDVEQGHDGHHEQGTDQVNHQEAYRQDPLGQVFILVGDLEISCVLAGVVEDQSQDSQGRKQGHEEEGQDEKHQEEHEPPDVPLADAVVNPGAVVVVLRNADPADIAVVAPLRHHVLALEAIFLDGLLVPVPQQLVVIPPLHLVRALEQGEVEDQHRADHKYLDVDRVPLLEPEHQVEDSPVDRQGDQKDQRNGHLPGLRAVLQLDITVKPDQVTARIILIQHCPDRRKIALNRQIHGDFPLLVGQRPVGPSDQQPPHHSRVPIDDCHHQRRVSLTIPRIQAGQSWLGQQVGRHLLTIHVGGPVQRRTLMSIHRIEVDPVLEVEQSEDDVLLRCKVQGVEAGVVGEVVVGTPLLDEVADDVEVAIEAGVEQGSEALVILLVDPDKYLLVNIFLEEGLLTGLTLMQSFLGLLDEEPDEVEMPLECQLMEHGVILTVIEVDEADLGVLLQVLVDLRNDAVVEEQLDDLALFASHILIHLLI